MNDPRAASALAVKAVIQDKCSLTDILPAVLEDSNQNRALIHELTAGTLRWWWRLSKQIDAMLAQPLKARDFDVYCLLAIGLYQIQFTRIPDYACVSQTVDSTKVLGKPWSKKLINAVLRRLIREHEGLIRQFKNDPVFKYSHPMWMTEQSQHDWPDSWENVLQANNQPNALTIRVNTHKTNVDEVCKLLGNNKIEFARTENSPVGILILDKTKIWHSELWQQGLISVQDESAQMVAYMAALKPGMRVLDACAAPGGKTCHLLELQPDLNLLALEKDHHRMEKLKENLTRLNLGCKTLVADAADLDSWWDCQPFDLVLLDAPCSGSGVINKHPDIKHLRRQSDIKQNVQTQRQLLGKLWPVLKTGGLLLYCTCSVFRQENDQQAQWFINKYLNARELVQDCRFGRKMSYGRQRLPSNNDSDGFYYVGFCKNPG